MFEHTLMTINDIFIFKYYAFVFKLLFYVVHFLFFYTNSYEKKEIEQFEYKYFFFEIIIYVV